MLNREVHLRPGQRADILVAAVPQNSGGESRLTVVIEVKGCWNADVKTALTTQLVEGYLAKNDLTHGIYGVGWFLCSRWDNPARPPDGHLASQSFEAALIEVAAFAASYDGRITPYVGRWGSAGLPLPGEKVI